MPKCTIIKTGATIERSASERVEELKNLIASIDVPSVPAAGDICFYDSGSGSLKIVDFEKWSADPSAYPSSQYTPIGVVAIPRAHNVYGTGQCGVMSLKFMSCSTPDEGAPVYESIYWGYNNLLLGDALNSCVQTGTCASPTATASGAVASTYMPSDYFGAKACPTDPEAFYYQSTSNYYAAPSPYLADGSRNPVYYQTTDPATEANCLADFDGVGKTLLMLDAVTVEGWQTSETINNSYSSGNYPSACCCWRYHTDGTAQGDWYLPACGEVGYVMARFAKINATIAALIEEYGSDIGQTIYQSTTSIYLWSSSEDSASNARHVGTSNGSVYGNAKNSYGNGNYVRAFLRV